MTRISIFIINMTLHGSPDLEWNAKGTWSLEVKVSKNGAYVKDARFRGTTTVTRYSLILFFWAYSVISFLANTSQYKPFPKCCQQKIKDNLIVCFWLKTRIVKK